MRNCLVGFTFILTLGLFLTSGCPTLAVEETGQKLQRLEVKTASREARMEERKENMASRAGALKARLQAFKDKTKAITAERVSDNLTKINKQRTAEMNKQLDKMSGLVARLEKRVAEVKLKGTDTTVVESSIAKVKEAITSARSAVKAQSEKDYTITVSSETNIKTDVKSSRNLLYNDLNAVHMQIVSVRKQLSETISLAASSLKGVGNGTTK